MIEATPTTAKVELTPNTVLKLPKPSYIILESNDGKKTYREDSFVVLRMLQHAQNKPTEEQRWETVKKWIASKLEMDEKEVTEHMALFLHNQVIGLTNILKEEVSKDVFLTASSVLPTQESQTNTLDGQQN